MATLSDYIIKIANIDAAIENALQNEVTEAVKEAIVAEAQAAVYDAYTPKFYSRRNGEGGILDKNSIIIEVHGTELTAKDNPTWQHLWGGTFPDKPLADALADGDARFNFARAGQRPFHEAAKRRVISDGTAEDALRRGLARQGIDTSGMTFKLT